MILTAQKYNIAIGKSVSIGKVELLFMAWNIGSAHIIYSIESNSVSIIFGSSGNPAIGVSASNNNVTLTNNHTTAISAYVWIMRTPGY